MRAQEYATDVVMHVVWHVVTCCKVPVTDVAYIRQGLGQAGSKRSLDLRRGNLEPSAGHRQPAQHV